MTGSPIATMFDRIAPTYDALNHLLSFHIDKVWRRKTARTVEQHHPADILDLATGTADLAITLARRNPQARIIGIDISEKMLEIGKDKVIKHGFSQQIDLMTGDAADLPFPDNHFDCVTVAFGVRNFEDLETGLREIHRVTKPGGTVIILEFSMPERFPVKQVYHFYFKRLLPSIGRRVSKDPEAYRYLPESVERFPKPSAFQSMLSSVGLKTIQSIPMTCGIATLFHAEKASMQ